MSSSTPSYVEVASPLDDDVYRLPFFIQYGHLEYTTHIPSQYLGYCDHSKALFLSSLSSSTSSPPPTSTAALVLLFLQHLVDCQGQIPAIRCLILAFQRDFVLPRDIHTVITGLPEPLSVQKRLLRAFYAVVTHCSIAPQVEKSILFTEAERGLTRLVAVFGGQNARNPRCVQDLHDIYSTYAPLLDPLVDTVDRELDKLCHHPDTADFYHGRQIRLRAWMDDPHLVPDEQYLQTAAVSFPIIGAIGLAHFCVVCRVLDQTPGQVRSLLHGVTGHSQGIVVAAGISRSDSWSSFYENVRFVMRTLFWMGYESQQAPTARSQVPAPLVEECISHGEGRPSPMLHISNIAEMQVRLLIDTTNRELSPNDQVYLALVNTRNSFVIAGPARYLVGLSRRLRTLNAHAGRDQSRIPFDRRSPLIQHQFLPITAPFHTPYLHDAAQKVQARLTAMRFPSSELLCPVYHTRDGGVLGQSGTGVLDTLVSAIMTDPVNWPSTIRPQGRTYALAFSQGVGDLLFRNNEGKGVRIIYSTHLTPEREGAGAQLDMYASYHPDTSHVVVPNWLEQFRPRLVRTERGDVQMTTKLTDVLGLPPVMVAGMTPTTVHWDFVAAIMDAGYHAELAGGGYYDADSMAVAITTLAENIPPGRGITCNVIYASPNVLAWQIALLRRLAQSGHSPVEGLTIGAGVPSLDVATEYITTLGLRHIAFKPGSESAIEQVLLIARAHPTFPVILQWTGGRAGGHHSFEDFHSPILRLYGKIRACSNVILVAGSGFGDAQSISPYLTGSWSVPRGYAPMPFDGILLGSRMMVAKEAHTSGPVKELICQATGVEEESQWTTSYTRPVGGIITVQSEMGQPIHKLATRGVRFWKEMDEQIFALPQGKQLEALQNRKTDIIRRLNADYFKPWFGRNAKGEVIDLKDMTYMEVLDRLVDLMYISHQRRWIHPSYACLVIAVMNRTFERLHHHADGRQLTLAALSHNPQNFLAVLRGTIPNASATILHPEDVQWFLLRCKARGQKPVNFIPVIDEDFAFWFKKDSLWQSEDVDAVTDQDAGRVCILHGPVAAHYSHRVDETVKEILDGINQSLVTMVETEWYQETPIPLSDGAQDDEAPLAAFQPRFPFHVVEEHPGVTTYRLLPDAKAPNSEEWFAYLTRETMGWMRAVVGNRAMICRDRIRRPNWLRDCLVLGWNTVVQIDGPASKITATQEVDGCLRHVLSMNSDDGILITAHVFFHSPQSSSSPVPLELRFSYSADAWSGSLSEVGDNHDVLVQSFYRRLWLGESFNVQHSPPTGKKTFLTAAMRNAWMSSIGLAYPNERDLPVEGDYFPIHAAIVPAWESLVAPLVTPGNEGDLLKLVHLSNEFRMEPGEEPLRIGDMVECSSSCVEGVVVDEKGKEITVTAEMTRNERRVLTVTSKFLIRGSFPGSSECFRNTMEPEITLKNVTPIDEALLRDRDWFLLDDPKSSLVGKTVSFRLRTHNVWSKDRKAFHTVRTTGEAVEIGSGSGVHCHRVGQVRFHALSCSRNPVLDLLHRRGMPATVRQTLDRPGWPYNTNSMTVQMPASSERYSQVSQDHNPIHSCLVFARIAQLPGTIVHGMYTSAVAGSVLEQLVDGWSHRRMHRYSVSFVGMVFPRDQVTVRFTHTAMIQGRMVVQIEAFRKGVDGEEHKVLEGEAEIEQPSTVPVARQIWDDMDEYFLQNYGFSILQIVKENPKELTIHFGGDRGRRIRERYQAMRINSINPHQGETRSKPVLPNLTSTTRSYTFKAPRGLIYSTQFAQPAITILEKAVFEDMRARGLIQADAPFAGHSLGEYGALAALAEFMPFPSLMDVVFYRGLAMQTVMERDEAGSTEYSMVAVNPTRVGQMVNETDIRQITAMIAQESLQLLEIVNLNVHGEQYVCAGHIRNIHALTETLNELSRASPEQIRLSLREAATYSSGDSADGDDDASTVLGNIVGRAVADAQALPKPIRLARGKATIPLVGIDVPFHSSLLRSGVDHYRHFLQARIQEEDVQPENLETRYIPNLTGSRFQLHPHYIAEVVRATGSRELKEWVGSAA
ncbi:hypothetical protein EYZ11_006621 [Aspergillus tanneri]|uniref:Uncharacterized protein n=1 Tax=Aspergillus tanneri TaxID=1220188 RepID=A0A4S3JF02_9EURO|nr:hypothetical protein EYZ11_006621 [Aspergillus tanneri]